MTLLQDIKTAMINSGTLNLLISNELNGATGLQTVYLHKIEGQDMIRVDLTAEGGEQAKILYLPWVSQKNCILSERHVSDAPADTLFLTYELSGCKVFGIEGGPIWHIDGGLSVPEFSKSIFECEWCLEHWFGATEAIDPAEGESHYQNVAYIHRSGEPENEWDLTAFISGAAPVTYGAEGDQIGSAVVGGIRGEAASLTLYCRRDTGWSPFVYSAQELLVNTHA